MSLFSKIKDKVFHRDHDAASPSSVRSAEPRAFNHERAELAPATPADVIPMGDGKPVNVEDNLAALAEFNGGQDNGWRTSIVDLLDLLRLDTSLEARQALAEELDIHAGEPDSAEQNAALHRAVMQKLRDNGGIVPDSLYG
ncbi:DUF3597 family protein [Phenylobacterium immobile]|uniref:DUF3597 family protein n=1 Tax=Phenylobacterium immobile TaxID=21 RepID=UPI000B1EF702|nr:DUF3597 family protein [Phenylobacterium immobile]